MSTVDSMVLDARDVKIEFENLDIDTTRLNSEWNNKTIILSTKNPTRTSKLQGNSEETTGRKETGNISSQRKMRNGTQRSNNGTPSLDIKILLNEIFTKCGDNCSHCEELILQLHRHIKLIHDNAMTDTSDVMEGNIKEEPNDVEKMVEFDPLGSVWVYEEDPLQLRLPDFQGEIEELVVDEFPSVQGSKVTVGVQCNLYKSVMLSYELKRSKEKDYQCRCCQIGFSNRLDLESHFNSTHPGEEPYKCEICGKGFSHSKNLTRHDVLVHAGQKSFKCNTCGYRFQTFTTFEKHKKSHLSTAKKPFGCVTCGMCFPTPAKLKRHIITHTGEKPFRCDLCGKMFVQNSNLKSHKKLLHKTEQGGDNATRVQT